MSAVTQLDAWATGPLTIQPLQPTIGAEIHGIDLRQPLSDELRDQIKAAILKFKVVFFRDQKLDREQHAAFARRFGPIYTPPYAAAKPIEGAPALHRIAAAEFQKREKVYLDDQKGEIQEFYHTDTSWRLVPSWGAVLVAVDLPPVGGDTIWVDAGLAYRELPEELKQRLEGLYVTHDFRSALAKNGHDYPIVSHPIVRTHRETGEKILWVNFSQHPKILGLDRAESREILKLIVDQYGIPEYQVRFSWRPGSVAFWDNRAAVHYAVRNYGDYPRVLERLLIADEPQWQDL
jgi:alpha-ketoglutarate-dependent sulfate ester dioxygenase